MRSEELLRLLGEMADVGAKGTTGTTHEALSLIGGLAHAASALLTASLTPGEVRERLDWLARHPARKIDVAEQDLQIDRLLEERRRRLGESDQ